jgi:hypothetical protein
MAVGDEPAHAELIGHEARQPALGGRLQTGACRSPVTS